MSKKSKQNKILLYVHCITLLNAIPYKKLSHWYDFQAHNHIFTASIHMLISINYSLRTLLLKSTMVIFFYFSSSLVNSKKQQLATSYSSFTQYTVLCAKTLIMACAYVGFFPVYNKKNSFEEVQMTMVDFNNKVLNDQLMNTSIRVIEMIAGGYG